MSILTANLKHFYQRRGLWFWYLILLCQFSLIFLPLKTQKPGSFVVYIIISFFIGIVTGDLQRDILTKPFSFCMPKHKGSPRYIVLGIGTIINSLFGLIFFKYPGLELPDILVIVLAACFTGMIFYLLGVWSAFLLKNNSGWVGFLPLIIMAIVFFELNKPVERVIISLPFHVITLGILAYGIAWKWLGHKSLARKYCGRILLGIADCWSLTRVQKYRRKKVAQILSKKRFVVFDYLERLFIQWMRKCQPLSGFRYVFGNLYIMLSRCFGPLWAVKTPLLIVLILFLGYYFHGRMSNLLFILPIFGAVQLNLIPYSNILLPSGRHEKYYGAIVSGFVVTILSTLLITILAEISILLSAVLPEITLKGHTFAYHAMDVKELYLCLSLIPIALIIGTLFPRKTLPKSIFGGAVMGTWMGFGFGVRLTLLSLIGILGVGIIIIASWASFLLIVRYHCLKRGLVSQSIS